MAPATISFLMDASLCEECRESVRHRACRHKPELSKIVSGRDAKVQNVSCLLVIRDVAELALLFCSVRETFTADFVGHVITSD